MPDITEEQVYKALGLDAPEVSGATEQEPAVPADPTPNEPSQPQGATEQELADPAPDDADIDGAEINAPAEGPEVDSGKQVQTLEERRTNAARRRQQEREAAVNAAVAAARQE